MTTKTKMASLALASALAVGALTPMATAAKADGWRSSGYGGYAYSQRYRSPRFDRGHNYNRFSRRLGHSNNRYVGRPGHSNNRYTRRLGHRSNGYNVLRRLRHSYKDWRHRYNDRRRTH